VLVLLVVVCGGDGVAVVAGAGGCWVLLALLWLMLVVVSVWFALRVVLRRLQSVILPDVLPGVLVLALLSCDARCCW